MADVVFSAGTCKKKEVINTMIDLMKATGWVNVSSNPSTDFFVMNSKGESGDKDLFIQIRHGNTSGVGLNPTDSTDYNVSSYRLIHNYTPGDGVAGTFSRPSEAWKNLYIVPTTATVNQEIEVTYYYHVNKDRIIFIIETPISLNYGPITHYLGLPVSFVDEGLSRGVAALSSAYGASANSAFVTSAPAEMPLDTTSSARLIYSTLPPKSPNSAGKHTPVEMYYGNAAEGLRGKLDGLYVLPSDALNDGDILTVGIKKYRAVVNGVSSTNSFPSTTMVYQIS